MANTFTNTSLSVSERTSSLASSVSDLAKGKSSSSQGALRNDGTIIQSERLFTARARYAQVNPDRPDATRGDFAYIKLLTSQKQYTEYLAGTNNRQITYKDLIGPDGALTSMADPKGDKTYGYDRFLLTGVRASLTEKVQVTEVFGDNEVLYFFGRQPMVFNLSGILIDSPDNN